MKKLLILMTLAALLGNALGCCGGGICNWWRRGPAYQQCPQAMVYPTPCQTVSSCDSCGGAPAVTPGPVTYSPTTP
jgi:hypothetical protein